MYCSPINLAATYCSDFTTCDTCQLAPFCNWCNSACGLNSSSVSVAWVPSLNNSNIEMGQLDQGSCPISIPIISLGSCPLNEGLVFGQKVTSSLSYGEFKDYIVTTTILDMSCIYHLIPVATYTYFQVFDIVPQDIPLQLTLIYLKPVAPTTASLRLVLDRTSAFYGLPQYILRVSFGNQQLAPETKLYNVTSSKSTVKYTVIVSTDYAPSWFSGEMGMSNT